MYRRQGYALLEILIILTFVVILLGGVLTISLLSLKVDSISDKSVKVIELTDNEVAFIEAFKASINSNASYIEQIKNRNFSGEMGNYITISNFKGMKMRFSGEYLYWNSYKNEISNTYVRVLQYEITNDNKFKIYILNRTE